MGVFDKLKQASSTTKKKSSSVRDVTDPNMQETVDRVIRASKALKNAEATWDKEQQVVVEYMRTKHAEGHAGGEGPSKSYKLNDQVVCTFTDRFSALDEYDTAQAMKILEEKKIAFDRLFKQKAALKMRTEVSTSEAKLQQLMDLLGDRVGEFFEIKVETAPVEQFDEALQREGCYTELADIVERHRAKPSIKVQA